MADGDAMLAHYGRCAAQTLTEEWKELKQVNPELSYPFAFTLTLAKANETPRYLTYALTSYQYLGGAHGMSSSYKFNIDKAHGHIHEVSLGMLIHNPHNLCGVHSAAAADCDDCVGLE